MCGKKLRLNHPRVQLFKRFIDNCAWFTTDMNNMHFSVMCCKPVSTVALKELTHLKCCPIPDDKKENVIIFLKRIDKLNMRGDYKELIDLSIFYLEGKPDDTFRFKSAGQVHKARWMGKLLFCIKLNLCKNKI